jgi:hypothetical protein
MRCGSFIGAYITGSECDSLEYNTMMIQHIYVVQNGHKNTATCLQSLPCPPHSTPDHRTAVKGSNSICHHDRRKKLLWLTYWVSFSSWDSTYMCILLAKSGCTVLWRHQGYYTSPFLHCVLQPYKQLLSWRKLPTWEGATAQRQLLTQPNFGNCWPVPRSTKHKDNYIYDIETNSVSRRWSQRLSRRFLYYGI